MSIGIIIQARMESERLPGKMYKKILDKHLLEWVILRTKKAKLVKKIVVAIPDTKKSSVLLPLIKNNKVDFYQGSLNNVLERYLKTAEKFIREGLRVCVDKPQDLILVKNIIKHFKPREDFTTEEILEYLDKNPKISDLNRHIKHNYSIPEEKKC